MTNVLWFVLIFFLLPLCLHNQNLNSLPAQQAVTVHGQVCLSPESCMTLKQAEWRKKKKKQGSCWSFSLVHYSVFFLTFPFFGKLGEHIVKRQYLVCVRPAALFQAISSWQLPNIHPLWHLQREPVLCIWVRVT